MSTPRVGSSAIIRPRLAQQHAREEHLLLVSARERADRAEGRAPRTSQRVEDVVGLRAARRRAARRRHAAELRQPRERHVLAHRAREDQARRPCATRESSPRPLAGSARGPPRTLRRRSSTISPALTRSAPKIARASSVRPAPTSPASPTISPRRTSSDASATPRAARPRAESDDGCVGRPGAAWAETPRSAAGRASPRRATPPSRSPYGSVSTTRPSRSTVTVSESSSTSRRKCEMRTIVFPAATSARTISCSLSVSAPLERRRRLVHHDHASIAGERAQDLDLLLLGRAKPAGGRCAGGGRTRPALRAARTGG